MAYIDNGPSSSHQPQIVSAHDLDMTKLRGEQFYALYDALTLAINGMMGIMNQPRSEQKGDLNPAGRYLENMSEFLHQERIRLIETLRQHAPASKHDEFLRMHLLVRYEAECADMSATDLAAFVLDIAREGKKWLS